MFFIISKLFTLFLMPFFWLFSSILWAFLAKNPQNKKKAVRLSIFILFIFGNSYLASKIMIWWEPTPVEISKMPTYDVAIILGGGIANDYKWPYDRVHFDQSADRLMQALQLYKFGKIKKILISAGNVSLRGKVMDKNEGDLSKGFLVQMGIPINDILVENRSKNTYENALFSQKSLKTSKLDSSKILLITSAYHMKRSLACFKKQGLIVDPFPAAYHQLNTNLFSFESIIPDEEAFSLWYDLFHEWYGIIIYKIMGYT